MIVSFVRFGSSISTGEVSLARKYIRDHLPQQSPRGVRGVVILPLNLLGSSVRTAVLRSRARHVVVVGNGNFNVFEKGQTSVATSPTRFLSAASRLKDSMSLHYVSGPTQFLA